MGSSDTAGMVLTSKGGGVNAFIMELSKEFELGEDKKTDTWTFKIHNPGKVALMWKFDDATLNLFSSTSWMDGAPTQVTGTVDAAAAIATTQSDTTGTEVTIKVKTGASYSQLPSTLAPRSGEGNPANVTLSIVSDQNAALSAKVTLVMKYKLTPLAAAPAAAPAGAPNATTPTGRKLLQDAAAAPAPAPSTAPTVEQLIQVAATPAAEQAKAKCSETTGSINLEKLPSGLNISKCSMAGGCTS
jgi:hypothetical protein